MTIMDRYSNETGYRKGDPNSHLRPYTPHPTNSPPPLKEKFFI